MRVQVNVQLGTLVLPVAVSLAFADFAAANGPVSHDRPEGGPTKAEILDY
jgi:hypothetical protein